MPPNKTLQQLPGAAELKRYASSDSMCLRLCQSAVLAALFSASVAAVSDSPPQSISAAYEVTVSGPNVACHVEGQALLDENLELYVPCSDHRVAVRPKFQNHETYVSVISVDELLDGNWNPLFVVISREAKISELHTTTYDAKDAAISVTLELNQDGQ